VTLRISETPAALLCADAVRRKADEAFALAGDDALSGWRVSLDALPACADFVVSVIRRRYPDLAPPFHARWRHFVFAGRDLWTERSAQAQFTNTHEQARAAFDLAITSVLLDAGAGPAWRYRDSASRIIAARSEGLALASLRLFESGGFSEYADAPLRADAAPLMHFAASNLADAFQVGPDNALAGLEGRARLLNRLGAQVRARGDLFARADRPRPGGLYDTLLARAEGGTLPAPKILDLLLEALGPIWEQRPILDGVSLGDCWPHPELGFTPLHKLSQWLAYSLVEPLQNAGVRVTEIDGLTGLAEYRNGGLFIDSGVLLPRDRAALARTYDVSDPFVVGWRTLTVALLDRLAPLVRARLGLSAENFTLSRVLEGGTWAAGRETAQAARNGAPPFSIISDGTVF